MPTWGDVLLELSTTRTPNGSPDFDTVRRKYLAALASYTGRNVIIYYADWLAGGEPGTAITLEDMAAMMEVCKDLQGPDLDVVLHTPGGSPEAVASIVRYLRQKFTNIRAFIPLASMSAGTMWALASDEIVMGKHSQLGPIDPQILQGQAFVPARAIVEQFEQAKQEIAADPTSLQAWFPILQQYGTALLSVCADAEELSKRLVGEWLESYMFAGRADARTHAASVADYFGDYTKHRSHSLGIFRDDAVRNGVPVTHLESDQLLQDAVLSVHHATMHTFSGPAIKIVENHLGRAYVKLSQRLLVPTP